MAVTVGTDVKVISGSVENAEAGEDIGKGDSIYIAADSKIWKAYNTDTVARKATGIAIMDATTGDQCYYIGDDAEIDLDPSVALTEGDDLYTGTTAGDLETYSELSSGDWKNQCGKVNKAGRLETRFFDEEETKT